jgi:RNA polymerase sigma-70 factor (ECF subfamily)
MLVQLVDLMQAGDLAARDSLIRAFSARLERLAHKMLARYPKVGRYVQVDDVLQGSLLRLLRALESVRPGSTRAFFGLAAEQMRRELLDLVRHFYGPEGEGAHHETLRAAHPGETRQEIEPARDRDTDDTAQLDVWCQFHQAVEMLPVQEREVVGLVYYHGWTQAQVAELFQVNVRTVRRWWESALARLRGVMEFEGTIEFPE